MKLDELIEALVEWRIEHGNENVQVWNPAIHEFQDISHSEYNSESGTVIIQLENS